MATSTAGLGPRFAPHDPTLPPPWRALVDGSTGYIYYWNPETNVTQYERPVPQAPPLPAGPPPAATSASVPISSTGPRNVSLMNGSMGAADAQINRPNDGQSDIFDGNLQANINGISHGQIGRATNAINDGIPHRNTSTPAYVNTGGAPHVPTHGSSGVKLHGNAPGSMHGTSVASSPAQPKLVTPGGADGNPHRSAACGNVHGSIGVPPVHGTMHGNSGPKLQGSSGGNMHGTSVNVHGSVGNMHGSGGNVHGPGGNAQGSSVIPGQPKLAAIPVPRRQNIGGVHVPLNSTVVPAHTNSTTPGPSGAPLTGSVPAYKRNANTYNSYGDQDPYKRPRIQGFNEPSASTDVESYRRQHEVTAVGDNVPDPFMTFDATGFPAEILGELRMAGFTSPTPIQAQSWPIVLQNRDIVAIAKTGSGKTLGYLLPAFLHLRQHRNNSQLGPTVLVLSPTRELATQIQDEAVKFGRSSRITSTCVYGGAPKGPQLRDLERGADIVIATPGRLNDFLEMRKVSLRQVTYLVLDEADRMLDMGFEPQICKIVNEIPLRRQTLMYTATWPKEVRKIAGDLLISPVQVNIGSADELTANKSITQHVEMVPAYEKHRRLEQILRAQGPDSRVIIFCSTKKKCDQLARTIGRDFGAAVIHGDKSQTERDHVLAQFKSGRSPILVATDVAARGLDIKDIRVVINFDFPTGIEDYVHRIGRTGRAGATGVAYTFFSEQDSKYAKELVKVLEGAGQKVPLELRDIAGRALYVKGRGGRWDTGGRGGPDGGRSVYRGGRGEGFGGRGAWGSGGQFADRRDRNYDRFGDQERYGRDGRPDRYPDDRNRGREPFRSFGDRGRGYSRSFSRSPSSSRDYSRSRSRSNDRYSDGYVRRSPYYGGISRHSRSPPRSPSPYHGGSPHHSSPGDTARHVDAPLRNRSPRRGTAFRGSSPQRGVSPRNRSPFKGYAPYRRGSPVYRSGSPYKGSSPALNMPSNRWAPSFNSSSPRKGMASPISGGSPRKDVAQYPGNDVPQKGILSNLNKSSPKVASPSEIGPYSKAASAHSGLPYHSLNVASHKEASSFESASPRKGSVPTPQCDSPFKDVSQYPSNVPQKGSVPILRKSSPPKCALLPQTGASVNVVSTPNIGLPQKGAVPNLRKSSPPKCALLPQTGASVNAVSTPNIGLPSQTSNVPSCRDASLYQSAVPHKRALSPVRNVSPCKDASVSVVSTPNSGLLPSQTSNVSCKDASLYQSTVPHKRASSPVRNVSSCKDALTYNSDMQSQKVFLPGLNKPFAKGVPLPHTAVSLKDTPTHKTGLPSHTSNLSTHKGASPFQSLQTEEASPVHNCSPHKDALLYPCGSAHKGVLQSLNRPSSPMGVLPRADSSANAGWGHMGLPYHNANVSSQKGTLPIQGNSPVRAGGSPMQQHGSPGEDVSQYATDVPQKVALNRPSTLGSSQAGLPVKVSLVNTVGISFQVSNIPSHKVASPFQCSSPQKRGTSPVKRSSHYKDVTLYPSEESPKFAVPNLNDSSPKGTSATHIGPSVNATSSQVRLPYALNVSSQKEALPSQSTLPQNQEGTAPMEACSPRKDDLPYPIDVLQKGGMVILNNSSTKSSPEAGTFVEADSSRVIGSC